MTLKKLHPNKHMDTADALVLIAVSTEPQKTFFGGDSRRLKESKFVQIIDLAWLTRLLDATGYDLTLGCGNIQGPIKAILNSPSHGGPRLEGLGLENHVVDRSTATVGHSLSNAKVEAIRRKLRQVVGIFPKGNSSIGSHCSCFWVSEGVSNMILGMNYAE